MGKIKGCGNETCEAHKKKLIYKESESFCSKCGSPLVYVCKDCYTKLSDDTAKYCVRCLANNEDRKDKRKKVAGVATGIGAGALVVVLKYGKKALDLVKIIKG